MKKNYENPLLKVTRFDMAQEITTDEVLTLSDLVGDQYEENVEQW